VVVVVVSSSTSPTAPTAVTVATGAFGAGQHLVGDQITAGRYYTDPSSGCYWERQSGLGGTLSEAIANYFIADDVGQLIVDIKATDMAFETDSECGTWYDTPRHGIQVDITAGQWLIGEQIQPGTYGASVSSSCYWERQSGFSGEFGTTIDNNFTSTAGHQLVTILASDEGFYTTDNCGSWSLSPTS